MWFPKTRQRLVLGALLALWVGNLLACGPKQFLTRWQPPARDFLVIGHRGAPNRACENTLESFAEALSLGANALELDVSMTHDTQLILWHDWVYAVESELRPMGACRLVRPRLHPPVHTIPLSEVIREYGYEQDGQRVQVTTLAQFVQRFAQDKRVQHFFLDLKIPEDQPDLVPPMFQRIAQTLRQYGSLSKAVFLTPYAPIFYRLHDEAQHWQHATGTRVDIAFDMEGPHVVQLSEWPSTVRRNQVADTRFALWGEPVVSLQSSRDFILAELQRRDAINARRRPQARMRFIVWTINDASDLCELVGLGVDGIMTDEPGRLHAIVRHWDHVENCRASSPLAGQQGGGTGKGDG